MSCKGGARVRNRGFHNQEGPVEMDAVTRATVLKRSTTPASWSTKPPTFAPWESAWKIALGIPRDRGIISRNPLLAPPLETGFLYASGTMTSGGAPTRDGGSARRTRNLPVGGYVKGRDPKRKGSSKT